MNDDIQNSAHVGALLSGYIDGELTQQDRQRVEVHCDTCSQCQTTLAELEDLRQRVGKTRLSELGEDKWREDMNDTTVNVSRGIGWLLIIGCALVVGAMWLLVFLNDTSMSTAEKFLIALIYAGPVALFISVLRQRLIERKTDKYKDVEI